MSEHTKEPWHYGNAEEGGGFAVRAHDDDMPEWPWEIAQTAEDALPDETGEANARRIVACVNACAGIPIEALEAGVVADMLAALRLVRKFWGSHEAWGDYATLNSAAGAFAPVAKAAILALQKVEEADEADEADGEEAPARPSDAR